MNIVWIVLVVLAAYFFLAFVALRLAVPFMGFGNFQLPTNTPEEIKNKILELERQNLSAEEYIKACYAFVVSRWHAGRLDTVFKAPLAFRKNLSTIWSHPGYAHCNTQNYILFVLLASSKYFQAADIEPRFVFFNFFIHQYLIVKVNNHWIDLDPAGAAIRGQPMGSHLSFFG